MREREERERERESVCVCVCVWVSGWVGVCGCEREYGRTGCSERDGVDLSASSKQKQGTTGHTLMLVMDSQTIVCLIMRIFIFLSIHFIHILGSVVRGGGFPYCLQLTIGSVY